MMRVELLTVGKELLIGRTLNTNAQWVGGRLARIGVVMKGITTIDDDLDEIAGAVRGILRRRPSFLIVVGGLGPTPDDMTLRGIALGLRLKMGLNRRALSMIRQHYADRGMADIELTPARRKMAVFPAGGEPVHNEVGTAPGVRLVSGKTVVFSLPGVPSEMRAIFRRHVIPEIRDRIGPMNRKTFTIKLEGIMESSLAPVISRAMKRDPRAYIKSHPRGVENGVSRLEVDVGVVAEEEKVARREALRIAKDIVEASVAAGGRVREGPKERR